MKTVLPPRYRLWIQDRHASFGKLYWFRYAVFFVSVPCMLALPFLYLLWPVDEGIPVLHIIITLIAVGGFVMLLATHFDAKANVRCSQCGGVMKHVRHDYPVNFRRLPLLESMFRYGHVRKMIRGDEGRQYVFCVMRSGQGGRQTCWYRVMQELRTCETCKRYVIIKLHDLVHIGGKRDAIDAYEQDIQRRAERRSRLAARLEGRRGQGR